jgi:hypothetical protein
MCLPWEAARAAAASEAIGLTPVLTGATFDSRNGGGVGHDLRFCDTTGRGGRRCARPATGEEWPVAWIG